MKIQKKKLGVGGGGGRVGGGQGGCDRRIEVFSENSKNTIFWGGGRWEGLGWGGGGSGWM